VRKVSKLLVAATAAAALTVLAATPALADPPTGTTPKPTDVVGVGSDTIESLFNQLSVDYNKTHTSGKLYSFDATPQNSTITTKSGSSNCTMTRPFGSTAGLDQAASRRLWRAIRDAQAFRADGPWGDRPLWRVSAPPIKGYEFAEKVSPAAMMFYDWAGGLIWIAPPVTQDCSAGEIRAAVTAAGGHAMLVRASPADRASLDPFQPEPGALAALTRRVKKNFDPKGVLNPGRMWAGV